MKRPPLATLAAEDLCRRFPEWPSRTLAKRLCKEGPELFRTVEQARQVVRRVRGNNGEHNRKRIASKTLFRPNMPTGSAWMDLIPAGQPDLDWTPLKLRAQRLLAISDLHIPFHDKDALCAALDYGGQIGVDGILINGDLLDFYAISFWQTDPTKRKLPEELQTAWKILSEIRRGFPDIPIWLKGGNHEERLQNYIARQAPELFGLAISDWFYLLTRPEIYDAPPADLKLTRIDSMKPVKFGQHLWILHGHEFGKTGVFNPVNAARGAFLRSYECTLTAHNHQTSEHTTRTLADKLIAAWSMGCLCDLHPRYMPVNWRWNHGFAIIHADGPENWRLENKKIIKGRVY